MGEFFFYDIILKVFVFVALIIFISLFFITAPYGRHTKSGWGPMINSRLGWLIMESPASLMMFLYFIIGTRTTTVTLAALLIVWQIHYLHRSFIYPFQIRSNTKMPVSIMFSAVFFNIVNTYIQGRWLFSLSPDSAYSSEWIYDPRFIAGMLIFVIGFYINKKADFILRRLRKPDESGYKIPGGWLYEYISCPNYFGEMLEWLGWAIATWSFAGLFFFIWTVANLAPRAVSNHAWYREKFPDYPSKRKALLPLLY
ncbi:MAG: DUF1295 domain-containing protein [Spirochaetes bacterium]|jgi:steroid 5-alpha-reductase/3-oxo-5-alpha-steroid 4-dehydrogenase 1|nr:DUF1295 domain-containing protein [Spirochaetota bacterium]